MKQRPYLASVIFLLAGSLPAIPVSAQTSMSSAQQTVRLQYAVAHFDSETHRLATMTNHQSSLAEYLQQLGIDPNNVVAVDIDSHDDRQNPLVAVFYHH